MAQWDSVLQSELKDSHSEYQWYTRSQFGNQYHSTVHGDQRSNYYKAVMNIEYVSILLHQWSKVGLEITKKLVSQLLFYLKNIEMGTLIFIHMEAWPKCSVSIGSVRSVCISCYVVYYHVIRRVGLVGQFKGTFVHIEKVLINDRVRVSKVSWKFRIPTFYNFAVIYPWNLLFS